MFKRYICTMCILGWSLLLNAQVTLPHFDSSVQVKTDNTAEIIETSTLFAEEGQPVFSFYRDLPVAKDQTIHLIETTLDGQKIEPLTKETDHSLRVFFLNEQPLPAGNHTFKLYYRIDPAVSFLKHYDRFAWNVITNTSSFPISFARLRLELPPGTIPLKEKIRSFITEPNGSIHPTQQEDMVFWSITPLYPYASFSILVPFQKGIIQKVTPSLLHGPNHKGMLLWLLLLLLGCYYWDAWNRVGRDPRAYVVRRHSPPAHISAVKAQYIRSMGKKVSIATVLLSLAIKGAVEIEIGRKGPLKNRVIVRPKLRYKIMEPLPDEEEAVYYGLFATVGTRWIVDPTDFKTCKRIQDTYAVLRDCLQADCARNFFYKNTLYNLPSFCFLLIGTFLLGLEQPALLPAYAALGIVLYILSFLACHHKQEKIFFLIGLWVLAGLLGLFPLRIFSFGAGTFAFVTGAILGGCFMEWIRTYTIQGRIIMDQLEGFKEYLLVGEKTRLASTDPTNSLKFFCRYLPYACALGISTKWTRRFENFLDIKACTILERNGLFLPDITDPLSGLDSFFFSIAASGGGKSSSRD